MYEMSSNSQANWCVKTSADCIASIPTDHNARISGIKIFELYYRGCCRNGKVIKAGIETGNKMK